MKLLIASNNPDKRAEMQTLLEGMPVEIVSLADFPDAPDVKEDGDTFQENAAKKACEMARYTGLHSVADDSGLCVDALDGAPGVMSARYAGRKGTYRDVCRKLLRAMRNVPDGERRAHFECHIALADPDGNVLLMVEGVCEGVIVRQPRGSRGFGYDPVFLYQSAGKTFAQMMPEEKHKFSHRGAAMREFREKLNALLADQKEQPAPLQRSEP